MNHSGGTYAKRPGRVVEAFRSQTDSLLAGEVDPSISVLYFEER